MTFLRLMVLALMTNTCAAVYAQDIKQKIQSALRTFESQANLSNGIVGFAVMDSKSGQLLCEKNLDKGLPTASTLKTVTSITALDVLGKDYVFNTNLYYAGTLHNNGLFEGDIIIEGTGDPTLGSDRYPSTQSQVILDKWVGAIRQAGITSIKGRIIADDLLFGGNAVPDTWMWGDIGNYYGAGMSGLNWKENKAGVVFTPSQVGRSAQIQHITEDLGHLEIINEVTTGRSGSGDNVYGYSGPYSEKIHLKGTYGLDLKKTIEISVPDPAYLCAKNLKEALQKEGVPVEAELTTGKSLQDEGLSFGENKKNIASHQSPPLSEIVYWFNNKSINLYGEALLKVIGKEKGTVFTTSESISILTEYWKERIQMQPEHLRMMDGSGLSPQNRITPFAMLHIMQYAQKQPWFDEFYKSLPTINGMKMKSGTIGGVLGYTGYQTSAKGDELTFVLLVNNYRGGAQTMRQQMFKLLDVLK